MQRNKTFSTQPHHGDSMYIQHDLLKVLVEKL